MRTIVNEWQQAAETEIREWIAANIDFSAYKNKMPSMGAIVKHFGSADDKNQVEQVLRTLAVRFWRIVHKAKEDVHGIKLYRWQDNAFLSSVTDQYRSEFEIICAAGIEASLLTVEHPGLLDGTIRDPPVVVPDAGIILVFHSKFDF